MISSKHPSEADRAAELAKMDLLPKREATKRTDVLLRTLLVIPPELFAPKQK